MATLHTEGTPNGPAPLATTNGQGPGETGPVGGRASPAPSDPREVLRGKRVLLVEDEVFIGMDLRHEAEAAGAVVTYARTLREGVRAAEANTFDGAVLDVTLGAEGTCEPIAERLRRVGTPFVLHSGDLDRRGEVIAGLGAPIVPKPSAPDKVIEALGRLMQVGKRH